MFTRRHTSICVERNLSALWFLWWMELNSTEFGYGINLLTDINIWVHQYNVQSNIKCIRFKNGGGSITIKHVLSKCIDM